MASLEHDAEMACRHARELRSAAQALRATSVAGRREKGHRLALCIKSYAAMRQSEQQSRPSPWSTLLWDPPGTDLDGILFPIE